MSILIGLLAVTMMLATLVTLPDGTAPNSSLLAFLPRTRGLAGLHAQLRFILAICTMSVLPLDALVGDRSRLTEAFAGILRSAAAIAADDAVITTATSNPALDTLRIDITVGETALDRIELARVFRPLAVDDCSLGGHVGESSLDLAMARAIMEAHDGAITAETDPVRSGASFEGLLPVRAVAVDRAGPDSSPAQANACRGLHILLVDDNRDLLSVLQRVMTHRGHITSVATTAAEAIALAERWHFDLVISDTCLPDKMGTELMRILHTRFGLRGFALSALNGTADQAASRAAGFEEHFTKPVRINALLDAVQRYSRVQPSDEPRSVCAADADMELQVAG